MAYSPAHKYTSSQRPLFGMCGNVPCQISLPATTVLTCPGLIEWQTIKAPIVVRSRSKTVFERTSCHLTRPNLMAMTGSR